MYRMANEAEIDYSASESEFPHLQTKTSSYGFTFISETPHTHRKESLLMGAESMEMLQEFQRKNCSISSCKWSGYQNENNISIVCGE